MNIIFMGTPDFAVPSLKILLDNGYNVNCVITQPDRPKGRGYKLTMPPVKEIAIKYGIEVLQPERIRNNEQLQHSIEQIMPDVIVVVAYGKILPSSVLNVPQYGCINVHASLLPKYRGAAPIQWAIINGEKTTGITTMFMDKGMDTGDMILKAETEIDDNETAGSLHDRLSIIGAEMLLKTVKMLQNGVVPREPQNHHIATNAPMINKNVCKIDWSDSAVRIKNIIRGLNPVPGAYTFFWGKRIRIWSAECIGIHSFGPGIIQEIGKNDMVIGTGDGCIRINDIHPESNKIMSISEYVRGHNVNIGMKFGI